MDLCRHADSVLGGFFGDKYGRAQFFVVFLFFSRRYVADTEKVNVIFFFIFLFFSMLPAVFQNSRFSGLAERSKLGILSTEKSSISCLQSNFWVHSFLIGSRPLFFSLINSNQRFFCIVVPYSFLPSYPFHPSFLIPFPLSPFSSICDQNSQNEKQDFSSGLGFLILSRNNK